ncbi:hypothetical protein BH11PSE12_BH11PSE12_29610 [soil metagenome]
MQFIYQHRQSGSTLIEIMVAIVVMAIGLLGLAGLQLSALKFEKSSSQRSEATLAAVDLSERIRSNFAAVQSVVPGIVPPAYTFNTDYATSSAAAHVPPNDCTVAIGCTPANVAANDLQEWLRNIQRRLIGGSGYVVPLPLLPAAGGTAALTFDVTIMWQEQGMAAVDPSCPAAVAAPVGVRCFVYRSTP